MNKKCRYHRKSVIMNEHYVMSSVTVFLWCLRDNWSNLRFHLISVINIYYIINKLIILVYDQH
jgi:hypothetical protein